MRPYKCHKHHSVCNISWAGGRRILYCCSGSLQMCFVINSCLLRSGIHNCKSYRIYFFWLFLCILQKMVICCNTLTKFMHFWGNLFLLSLKYILCIRATILVLTSCKEDFFFCLVVLVHSFSLSNEANSGFTLCTHNHPEVIFKLPTCDN